MVSKWWLIAAIAVIVVLVLAFLILLSRRKADATPVQYKDQAEKAIADSKAAFDAEVGRVDAETKRMQDRLTDIERITDEEARLKALADLANSMGS